MPSRSRASKKAKFERCVLSVKARQSGGVYSPYAVCAASIYGKQKTKQTDKRGRKLYRGPSGGVYFLRKGKKVYTTKSKSKRKRQRKCQRR